MRKIILFMLIILVLCLFITADKEELRVRIVPKDNQETSLAVKEEVKVLVINYLSLAYDDTYSTYIKNINDGLSAFNEQIATFSAKARLVKHKFMQKIAGGEVIKDETVLTFLVEIEESAGDNWWGIIYPSFLGIESTEVTHYESYIIKKIREWFK